MPPCELARPQLADDGSAARRAVATAAHHIGGTVHQVLCAFAAAHGYVLVEDGLAPLWVGMQRTRCWQHAWKVLTPSAVVISVQLTASEAPDGALRAVVDAHTVAESALTGMVTTPNAFAGALMLAIESTIRAAGGSSNVPRAAAGWSGANLYTGSRSHRAVAAFPSA